MLGKCIWDIKKNNSFLLFPYLFEKKKGRLLLFVSQDVNKAYGSFLESMSCSSSEMSMHDVTSGLKILLQTIDCHLRLVGQETKLEQLMSHEFVKCQHLVQLGKYFPQHFKNNYLLSLIVASNENDCCVVTTNKVAVSGYWISSSSGDTTKCLSTDDNTRYMKISWRKLAKSSPLMLKS